MCACCGHISPAPCSSAANAWKISSRRRRIKPGMRRWGACRQRSTAGRNSSSPIKCPLNPRWFWRIAANLLLFKNNVFSLHPIGSYCHLLELARWTCFFLIFFFYDATIYPVSVMWIAKTVSVIGKTVSVMWIARSFMIGLLHNDVTFSSSPPDKEWEGKCPSQSQTCEPVGGLAVQRPGFKQHYPKWFCFTWQPRSLWQSYSWKCSCIKSATVVSVCECNT